jgi:hypothetical protein
MVKIPTDPREIERILKQLSPDERDLFQRMMDEQAQGKYDLTEQVKKQVFEAEIPPIDEFVFGKKYLGLPKTAIFPRILDLIYAIDKPDIREAFICAGKGSGKSTITSVLMARATHTLLCYRAPADYFALMPKEMIAVVNMSIGADQAEHVMFTKYKNLLDAAPCFHNALGDAVYYKKKRHIEFPKEIHALSGHSGYRAYFGYNVFCGVLDEVDWYKDVQDREISDEIYQGVVSSAMTRFEDHYKVVGISSPQSADGFLLKKFNEVKEAGQPVVMGEVDGDSYAKVN